MEFNRRFLYVGNHAGHFLTHRLPIMQAVRDEGYEVHVAMPAIPDTLQKLITSDARYEIEAMGFHFHSIPLRRKSMGIFREGQTLLSLYRLYRHLKPDFVYHATIKPVLYGGLVARLTGVPGVIYALTGSGYLFISNSYLLLPLQYLARVIFRFVLNHPNAFTVFQNKDDRTAFVQQRLVQEHRTVLIKGSGVDVEQFIPTPESQDIPLVVLPSRMLWDKGVAEFVEAAKILQKKGVKARFALVGDSDPDNHAAIPQSQLHAWQESKIVEWWGWWQNMQEIYRQAHIVCLPSYREGLPKVLIEAAAAGRAIVTTDVPGCREVVIHGENGLLVPVRNAPRLAEALALLIEDKSLRQKMAARGRKRAEQEFSTQVVTTAFLDICRQLH